MRRINRSQVIVTLAYLWWWWCLLCFVVVSAEVRLAIANSEQDVAQYLERANEELRVQKNLIGLASWAQSSNITDENNADYIQASAAYDAFAKKQFDEMKRFFSVMPTLAPHYRRQLQKLANIGTSALSQRDATTFSEVSLRMQQLYSTATIAVNGKPDLALEPDLTNILANSRDENELRQVWINWRDATGAKMRQDYITYYTLGNKAAKANQLPGEQFETYDDLWMAEWETPDMKQQVNKLMMEAKPIYEKLHAYVRYFLVKEYGSKVMPSDGTIPAHLLGDMWAQQWSNLLNKYPAMRPYPDVPAIDEQVNERLASWSVRQMFELSESFFHSLGMQNMTEKFWNNSILEKPTDRNLTCHASAWDFYSNEDDFRIKQCTEKTMSDLVTVHHEMGHVQYYMNYKTQPTIYRRGANPGFHEAIGDLIALSVATPQHLFKVGLVPEMSDDTLHKINLNYQMKMALDKLVFLPFAYVMDKWRWDVFSQPDAAVRLNERWWQLRLRYQGVSPPKGTRKRTEADMDAGAKYHIAAGVEYVRYFVSHVLQFQFYEAMCRSVEQDSLFECDFAGNREAGKALIEMLAKGSAQQWPDVLQAFTGSREMSLGSMRRYFKPLLDYLDRFIAENNIVVGWQTEIDQYVQRMSEQEYLTIANQQYAKQTNALVLADWAMASNITDHNEQALLEATKDYNQFRQRQLEETKSFNYTHLKPYDRRQFEKFAVIGTSALNESDTTQFQAARLGMETTFSTATITAGGESDLALEPDLTEILATSSNETLLREVWLRFRDATGAKMRNDFITYFKLGNRAAQLNSLPEQTFRTFDDLWMFSWETPDLKQQVAELMQQIKPLYEKVHSYVRYHLSEKYGAEMMPADGTIPAHLLGNMWAQSWSNLLNIIPALNPNQGLDPIDSLVNKKLESWEIEQMYQLSEKFFADLGMANMTAAFWRNSILRKPLDRNLTCHASAWDFFAPPDFRIKQCTSKTMNQLVTVHHEMGHIQYFMNYASQAAIYREGANAGFHEAIGDLVALSVGTPQHLTKVGLLEPIADAEQLEKINLNYQMKMALDKIVFLPFAYVMDKWRWDVFGDARLESTINRRWWQLTLEHQGVSPPVNERKRNERDFDPGAKYHIPAGVEYVRYFVSHVLQFQFFARMCQSQTAAAAAGKLPLYQCDFDGDTEAGGALIRMLQLGSSDTWQNILQGYIGSSNMSIDALRSYFEPLDKFLTEFIAQKHLKVGWDVKVDNYVSSCSSVLPPQLLLWFIALLTACRFRYL